MDASGKDDDGPGLVEALDYEDPDGLYDVSMEDVTLEQGLGEALDRLSTASASWSSAATGWAPSRSRPPEVASQMGVSLERVRQIQMRALGKPHAHLRKAIDPL